MPEELQQSDVPPQSEGGAPPEPIGFDVDELFLAGTSEPADVDPAPEVETPSVEAGDEPDDEDADDADSGVDDPEEPAAEQDSRTPDERLFEYATIVAQNPNRISEVPSKQRPEVLKRLLAAAYQRGQQDQGQQFQRQSSTEEQLRAFVAERSEARKSDPDGFAAWEDENPADAERYHGGARYFKEKAAPVAESQSSVPPEVIQQRANAKLARVNALPDGVRQQFVQRVQSGDFPLTEQGLDALEEALFTAATTRPAPIAPAPRSPQVERRQLAAATRGQAPRAVGVGSGGSDAPTVSYDPDVLFNSAFASR